MIKNSLSRHINAGIDGNGSKLKIYYKTLMILQKNRKGHSYCLQPLVVKKCTEDYRLKHNLDPHDHNSEWYEVIDGQQRLTTVRLLLLYLSNKELQSNKMVKLPPVTMNQVFTLDYETRKDSKKFLDNPTEGEASVNIDYYHIFHAYNTIREWLPEYCENMQQFFNTFLENKAVRFIWYEVKDEKADGIDIFTRINAGKIPLTNAELIKSLFLRQTEVMVKEKYPDDELHAKKIIDNEIYLEQLHIASEWDRIEIQLQDDLFWSFIYYETDKKKYNVDNERYDTHIEYIFALITGTENNETENNEDKYATFRKYSEKFKNSQKDKRETLKDNWGEVKNYFCIFEEWYNDHEMYHLIGYIVNVGIINMDMDKLITKYQSRNIKKNTYIEYLKGMDKLIKKYRSRNIKKDTYIEYLREIIGRYIKNKTEDISELSFPGDKDTIIHILLLHNLETIMDMKISWHFPFHEYEQKEWSIEHIYARNSEDIANEVDFEPWVNEILDKVPDKKISEEIQDIKKKDQDIGNKVAQIVQIFGEIDVDSLGNLALLGKEENSGLSNYIFPIKRHKIIQYDKGGSFIPPCTRNVFLKYYSNSEDRVVNQLVKWEKEDGNAYIKDIKKKLAKYIDTNNGDAV